MQVSKFRESALDLVEVAIPAMRDVLRPELDDHLGEPTDHPDELAGVVVCGNGQVRHRALPLIRRFRLNGPCGRQASHELGLVDDRHTVLAGLVCLAAGIRASDDQIGLARN